MLIVHRCTSCRHPDIWAEGTTIVPVTQTATSVIGAGHRDRCGVPWSGPGHHGGNCTWGPPELMREWQPFGELITDIRVPGTYVHGFGRTCDCDACKTFHASHAAQPHPAACLTVQEGHTT